MRFKVSKYNVDDGEVILYIIEDESEIFKNITCVNPSDEELENFTYICDCLNKLNDNCSNLANLLHKGTDDLITLRERVSSCLYKQVDDCKEEVLKYKDKDDEDSIKKMIYTQGKMDTIHLLLKELVNIKEE